MISIGTYNTLENGREDATMGLLGGAGSCSCAGAFTSSGVILVLFILLVIISRAVI